MTRAPASRACSAVRSVLPLSTTITSSGTPVARHSRTTPAIGSSSFNAGMTTDTLLIAEKRFALLVMVGKRQVRRVSSLATFKTLASQRHALLQNQPRACEINRQRNEVGQHEREWARGNFRIELQPMQKRGHSQTKCACRHQRERNASADNSCRTEIVAPRPGDDADNEPATNAKQHCGCQFATERRREPIPGHVD